MIILLKVGLVNLVPISKFLVILKNPPPRGSHHVLLLLQILIQFYSLSLVSIVFVKQVNKATIHPMSRPKSITSASLKVYSTDLNLDWVRPYLPLENEHEKANAKILALPLNGAGGILCSLYAVSIENTDSTQSDISLIYKATQATDEAETVSKSIGQAREALFILTSHLN